MGVVRPIGWYLAALLYGLSYTAWRKVVMSHSEIAGDSPCSRQLSKKVCPAQLLSGLLPSDPPLGWNQCLINVSSLGHQNPWGVGQQIGSCFLREYRAFFFYLRLAPFQVPGCGCEKEPAATAHENSTRQTLPGAIVKRRIWSSRTAKNRQF